MNRTLSFPTILVMAFVAGICIANIYYCQPLLNLMKQSFQCTDGQASWIVSLCQIGYACGMCFFIPLGDLVERRRLILIFLSCSALALAALSFATSLPVAYLSSFLIGLTAMPPHLSATLAASLVEEKKRGQTVGIVMGGLALGLLLGRAIGGFFGPLLGWQNLFRITALGMIFTAVLVRSVYPEFPPRFQGSYLKLIRSILTLVRTEPVLREAMLFGALLFGAFNSFWVNLIHLMDSEQFHLGAPGVGAFALLGSTSVLFSTLAGKWVDRGDPRKVTGIAVFIMILGFLVLWAWGEVSLPAVAVGVILLDIAAPSGTVSNQARIYSLPIAGTSRSRLNSAYMTAYFVGGALGSALSSWAWIYSGWVGVCWVALAMLAIATVRYFNRPS